MQFNELKSKTMLIARKRKSNRENINIYLNNRRLEQVKEVKYLGIIFDNLHKHIEHTTEKSRKMIYVRQNSQTKLGSGTQIPQNYLRRGLSPSDDLWSSSLGRSHKKAKTPSEDAEQRRAWTIFLTGWNLRGCTYNAGVYSCFPLTVLLTLCPPNDVKRGCTETPVTQRTNTPTITTMRSC